MVRGFRTVCAPANVELALKHYPGGFTIERRGGFVKSRTLHVLCSGMSHFRFGVHDADVQTALRGIVERVFIHRLDGVWQPPHQPKRADVFDMLAEVRGLLAQHARKCHPWSHEQFIGSYRGRKRAVYERAALSFAGKPLSRRDSYLSTFVKAEKLNLTSKPDPSPRVIQPRNPRFNLCIGVFVKPIEHRIYHDLDKMINLTMGGDCPSVMKGLNAATRGQAVATHWSKFADPVCIVIDAHRMDQHLSVPCLQWVHEVYRLYNADSRFHRLLKWQLRNKGFVRCKDGSIKYQVAGRGMSGDMDTSLRNIVIMVCLFFSLFLKLGRRYALINDGDDNNVFCERSDAQVFLEALPEHFLHAGFVMQVEKVVDQLELVEFCQSRPVYDGERWVMCRDPRVVISKDSYCIKSITSESEWNVQRKSVSECGLSLAGNLPVLGEFYAMLGRGAGDRVDAGFEDTGFARLARGMNGKLSPPSDLSRVSFYKAFGILPDAQISLEQMFRCQVLQYKDADDVFDFSQGLFRMALA